jgi:hypothetical protein
MAVARRAPEHSFTKIKANGGARSGTRNIERVVCFQATRRAPEHGFTKIKANGGARSGTRNVERVVVYKRHGEPLITVLRRLRSTGAPQKARETLSVLFVSKQHGEPLITVLRRFNSTEAAKPRRSIRRKPEPRKGFTVRAQWDWRGLVAKRSNAEWRGRSGATTGGHEDAIRRGRCRKNGRRSFM